MKIHSPLFLLGALGVLSAGAAVAAPDTSAWKCESCPYPEGTTASVDVGVGIVSDDSARFGTYTGLESEGAYLVLGGSASYRGDSGYFADLSAADLGIDVRNVQAQVGREGVYRLELGYGEIPRYFGDDATTPFLGNGGNVLTLPAGYPGAVTGPATAPGAMPLATTLQPVDLDYKRSRFDVGGTWIAGENLTYRVSLRKDQRDGTRPLYGSFYSTASQLAAPLDDVTDQLEIAAQYTDRRFQATLAYQLSQYRNRKDSLTWDNPFEDVLGGTRGQLALAPDNQFHQIMGSAGYQITPTLRASADLAVGRMTQDAGYLAPTLNTGLAVPALPVQSLDGSVDTLNGSVKLSAAPLEGLRLNASYTRNVHENQTSVQSYPQVATDMFLRPLRSNTPFDFTQDRFQLNADYRASDAIKLSGGAEHDRRDRSYQEAVTTRETTIWGRMAAQVAEDLALSVKLAHGDRDHSTYGVAYWFGYTENPLLRKANLAARTRNSMELRGDFTLGEGVTLGVLGEVAIEDYDETPVGLTYGRSSGLGADLSAAITETLMLQAYVRSDWLDSRQAGSEQARDPDWYARHEDRADLLGLGLRYAVIEDKLDLGADLVFTRSDSDIEMDTTAGVSDFPTATTSMDSFKLFATYRLAENLSVTASYWYERYKSADWRLDGVQPDTVPSLLSYGMQAPQYRVNVFQVALRYGF